MQIRAVSWFFRYSKVALKVRLLNQRVIVLCFSGKPVPFIHPCSDNFLSAYCVPGAEGKEVIHQWLLPQGTKSGVGWLMQHRTNETKVGGGVG